MGTQASAIEEIRALKHRYLRGVDLKRWDELAGLLTEDATAEYGTRALGEPLRLTGRDGVVDYLRGALGNDIATSHLAGSHEILLDGDAAATGSWSFQDQVVAPGHGVIICGAGYYDDRYARGADGAWRIAHTGYTRLYETMQATGELPGFRLLATRWAEAGA